MTANNAIIAASGLSLDYNDSSGDIIHALTNIEISVSPGELVAIIGPSGSGKSTLLHIVGGLQLPSAGRINVAGCDLTKMNEEVRTSFRRENIGFIFQAFHLVPTMTIAENVALSAIITNGKRSQWETRSYELLVQLGIDELEARYPHQLSGGERQRVAIARAMFARPAVILADEPTGNLDSASSLVVLSLLREVVNQDSRVCGLLVTHDLEAASVADRVIAVRDGHLVDQLKLTHDSVELNGSEGGMNRVELVRSWMATTPI